ncbi:MAG: F0F1 ATP synthase subunit A [Leptospirales bacterium]|nr:F0F1 ATP synthase subunit A [Leptospirales bacterium]
MLAALLIAPAALQAEGGEFDFQAKLNHHLNDSVIFPLQICDFGTRACSKIRPGDAAYEDVKFVRTYEFRDEQGLFKYSEGLPLHITRRVAMMLVAALILCVSLIYAARKIARNPYRVSSRWGNMIESMFLWMRSDVAEEGMHDHSRGFEPYLLTLFFFLLVCNLFGLFPPIGEAAVNIVGALSGHPHHEHVAGATESPLIAIWPGITVTGDIAVTMSMALITMVMTWVTGFRYQGFKFLWTVVPNGVPLPLYFIMWPLEFIVSPIARSFALTVRLLANMTGGHVLLLALIGFIFQVKMLWFSGVGSAMGAAGITLASVAGSVAIYMLEVFVAFLQAFIFAILTSLFIGGVMHRH